MEPLHTAEGPRFLIRGTAHAFVDGELAAMAEIAFDLGAKMALTYLSNTVAENMLSQITTTGLFMSIHSASPGQTGASELVAGTAYTAVSGGRPPLSWGSLTGTPGTVVSNDTQTYAMLVTESGGIPYFGIWTANTSGTYLAGGTTTGLSGSIPSGANVTFTSSVTLTVSG
jgi:hypothetical protein